MSKEIKKIDMHKKPMKMNPLLVPIVWIAVHVHMLTRKHKIVKENFKKLPKGCLILSNHMSFEDMKLLMKFILPRRSYFLSSIDEFIGKEWIMRQLGCIPKKVHYSDIAIVKTIVKLLKKENIVTIYPEATYSFAGVTNDFDQGLGKLAKLGNVPVIVIRQHGNYLFSPRWNTNPKNMEVPLLYKAKMVVSKEEVKTLTADQIQQRINEYFEYDDYKYQRENNIKIKSETKAKNIERILYRCPHCENEMCIKGEGNDIICTSCNAKYHIDELSILRNVNGDTKFTSISDWFTWQRKSVKEQIENETLNISFPVKISKYLNPKLGFDHNFAKGNATLSHHGIVVDAKVNEDGSDFHYEYNEKLNSTIHLTYDVKGCQDSGFEVHNATDSYMVYPLDGTSIIKVRFAIEEAHKHHFAKQKIK